MKALHDVPAPAKLNLFLHVIGRRPDGHHLLQSAFMLIDWHDTLHFELRHDGRISREDLGAVLPAHDLCVRAAQALRQATGCAAGVHIAIEKRIPAQAGMGGGSSDAASCLLALNRLWRLALPLPVLEKIGLALGADVPFFLRGRNAWIEGIGERITPIDLPPARFAVLKPPGGLETRLVFSHPELKRDTRAAIISGFAANPYGFGSNDLQSVAQGIYPGVADALDWLRLQGVEGRMTGSGSAVFAQVPENVALPSAAVMAPFLVVAPPPFMASPPVMAPPPAGWQLKLCGNLAVHPLWGWARSED